MVMDQLTKYAAFIPTISKLIANGLINLLIIHIYSRYGIFKEIVSDKGSLFTSKFWATLCYYLAIKRKFSIIYHPQTDGQTKRMNQQLKHYLRIYCYFAQNDWIEKLLMASWVYNTLLHSALGNCSSAKALMGFQSKGPYDLPYGDLLKRAIQEETKAKNIQQFR
jgi:transposase InsO family protein